MVNFDVVLNKGRIFSTIRIVKLCITLLKLMVIFRWVDIRKGEDPVGCINRRGAPPMIMLDPSPHFGEIK